MGKAGFEKESMLHHGFGWGGRRHIRGEWKGKENKLRNGDQPDNSQEEAAEPKEAPKK